MQFHKILILVDQLKELKLVLYGIQHIQVRHLKI